MPLGYGFNSLTSGEVEDEGMITELEQTYVKYDRFGKIIRFLKFCGSHKIHVKKGVAKSDISQNFQPKRSSVAVAGGLCCGI